MVQELSKGSEEGLVGLFHGGIIGGGGKDGGGMSMSAIYGGCSVCSGENW